MTAYNTAPGPDPDEQSRTRAGVLSGFAAYGIWGLLPLYFVALEPATPVEPAVQLSHDVPPVNSQRESEPVPVSDSAVKGEVKP